MLDMMKVFIRLVLWHVVLVAVVIASPYLWQHTYKTFTIVVVSLVVFRLYKDLRLIVRDLLRAVRA